MQVCGIIAEFNPFHKGHDRLLTAVREQLPEARLVCVMSGPFTQRGEPAILDKWARAEAAVAAGMNVVFELHSAWATASLQSFSFGAVKTLAATGLVTHLAFGSESGNLPELNRMAALLQRPTATFQQALKSALAKGAPFAVAQQEALEMACGARGLQNRPNDRLAISYLRFAPTDWTALAVQRDTCHDGALSARAIRQALQQNRLPANYLTTESASQLKKATTNGWLWPHLADFYTALQLRLINLPVAEISRITGCSEGMAVRLRRAARTAESFDAWLDTALDRHLFETTLSRAALQLLLPVATPAQVPYLRVLAADAEGRRCLRAIQQTASTPVVTNTGRDGKKLTSKAQAALQADVARQEAARLLQTAPAYRRPMRDYYEPPRML